MRSSDADAVVTRQFPDPAAVPATPARGTRYAELSRQIRQAGLLRRRTRHYAWRIAITTTLLAAGWAVFVLVGNSWWQLGTAVFLAVMFTQAGFLGHDAGHQQISGSRRVNYVLGILHGNLGIGLSYGWWVSKHNRHHAHPNTEGKDPDISISTLAFTAGQLPRGRGLARLGFRYQAYLFFPMLLARGGQPARREHPRAGRTGIPPPAWEAALLAAHLAWLPGRGLPGALTGQGGGVHRRAAGPVRPVPGHARSPPTTRACPSWAPLTRATSSAARCLPPVTCRGGWLDRLRPRRPELPDRAPPVPLHAPAQPAPLAGPDRGVLPAARRALLPEQPGGLLRSGAAAPQRGRQAPRSPRSPPWRPPRPQRAGRSLHRRRPWQHRGRGRLGHGERIRPGGPARPAGPWRRASGELDPLVFRQAAESLSLDGGVVNEDVGSAVVWGDKTVTLVGVEPLHDALSHVLLLLRRSSEPRTRVPGCCDRLHLKGWAQRIHDARWSKFRRRGDTCNNFDYNHDHLTPSRQPGAGRPGRGGPPGRRAFAPTARSAGM